MEETTRNVMLESQYGQQHTGECWLERKHCGMLNMSKHVLSIFNNINHLIVWILQES